MNQQNQKEKLAKISLPFEMAWSVICFIAAYVYVATFGLGMLPVYLFWSVVAIIYGIGLYVINETIKRFKGTR